MTTTAPITSGQIKELSAALIEAIPTDLSSNEAQEWIGKKRELGDIVRMVLRKQLGPLVPDIDWQKVYATLGMEAEYNKAMEDKLPGVWERSDLWIVPVLKGASCNKVVAALRKLGVEVSLYCDDLDKDVSQNDRSPDSGNYVVVFCRNVEADEENKNKSANDLAKANHKGITLLERLLLELGYFLATGKHLDEKNLTLCSGSRDGGGCVPSVRWSSDRRKVYVDWGSPGCAYGPLRSRSVVS